MPDNVEGQPVFTSTVDEFSTSCRTVRTMLEYLHVEAVMDVSRTLASLQVDVNRELMLRAVARGK